MNWIKIAFERVKKKSYIGVYMSFNIIISVAAGLKKAMHHLLLWLVQIRCPDNQ